MYLIMGTATKLELRLDLGICLVFAYIPQKNKLMVNKHPTYMILML
jgi:hypothetical protein